MSLLLMPRRRSHTRKLVRRLRLILYTAEAIKHLKEAINQGKKGNAVEATTHAEMAMNHLQQVH